jgi:hypothetical protein
MDRSVRRSTQKPQNTQKRRSILLCELCEFCVECRTLSGGLAAGGDPMVGRPGMSVGCSVDWLTAQGKTYVQSTGGQSSLEER